MMNIETNLAVLRQIRRADRLSALRQEVEQVTAAHPKAEVWLFGSLARGNWDAYSDVDLLAIAPARPRPRPWPTPCVSTSHDPAG